MMIIAFCDLGIEMLLFFTFNVPVLRLFSFFLSGHIVTRCDVLESTNDNIILASGIKIDEVNKENNNKTIKKIANKRLWYQQYGLVMRRLTDH